MREAFEAVVVKLNHEELIEKYTTKQFSGQYVYGNVQNAWVSYQAATAQQNERIKDLEAQIEHQRAMLTSRDSNQLKGN